jgi:hypothetical protein
MENARDTYAMEDSQESRELQHRNTRGGGFREAGSRCLGRHLLSSICGRFNFGRQNVSAGVRINANHGAVHHTTTCYGACAPIAKGDMGTSRRHLSSDPIPLTDAGQSDVLRDRVPEALGESDVVQHGHRSSGEGQGDFKVCFDVCCLDRPALTLHVIRKPELGSRVTHVSIQHYPLGKHTNYSEGRCRETYSRPEAFALFNWDKPGQSVRRILLTPRKTVETAIKVVPRLPNVRSITINLLPVSLVRHANLHHSLWSTFTSSKIVQLTIKIHIPQIETIASFIESAPSVLRHLEELVICLTGTEISSETLQRSLHAIVNPARQTIQSVIVSSTNQLDPEAIIQGIGQIQNLTRLQLNLSALMIHKLEDADLLTRFLKQHKSTLKHLSFKSLPYESLERRWFAPGLGPVYCPPLKSISLRIERVANDQTSLSFPLPHLVSFSGSLTTLLLDLGSHFLNFEDTRKLVKSLYRVPGGALLRELKIAIQPLKAEFFDVFADDLENLEVLDLTYALSPEGLDDVEGRVSRHWI